MNIFHGLIELQHLHRFETNCIAERVVRRVKEGTSVVLLQSGVGDKWWADSVERCSYLRNVSRPPGRRENSFYERRFGTLCKGPTIPFGAMVEYHPLSAKDHSRLHQFGRKVLPGIFLGYALRAGGFWKGDILVADSEEVENFGRVRNPCSKTQCKRNYNAEIGEHFISPIADGTVK